MTPPPAKKQLIRRLTSSTTLLVLMMICCISFLKSTSGTYNKFMSILNQMSMEFHCKLGDFLRI